jgi:hypothetical protein
MDAVSNCFKNLTEIMINNLELYYNNTRIPIYTAGEIMVDRRNSQWKWIPILRDNTGLILLQDNGTPTNSSDDKVVYRSEWMDQNGHLIAPEFIYCMVQDYNNTIWVGTSKGLFIIKQDVRRTSGIVHQCPAAAEQDVRRQEQILKCRHLLRFLHCLVSSLLRDLALLSSHTLGAILITHRIDSQNSLQPCACCNISSIRTAQMISVTGKVITKE